LIPYFQIGPWHLGGLRITPLGVGAAAALMVWLLLAIVRARRLRLDPWPGVRLLEGMLIGGIAGAFLLAPLLTGHRGLSSFGGMFGALAGATACRWLSREIRRRWWEYLDLLAWTFPFGWALIRLGCFLLHEHPGRLATQGWLTVAYPGGSRYDLALLELLATLAAALAFAVLGRKPRRPGFYLSWLVLCGPLRIALSLFGDDPGTFRPWTGEHIAAGLLTATALVLLPASRRSSRMRGGPVRSALPGSMR
jgi:phosphatidylglycerol---prolipoprotein diacylglyceryl transferase